MKQYELRITEKLSRRVVVEVEDNQNLHDAILKLEEMYFDSEIVLDSSDYVDYEVTTEYPYDE